MVARESMTEEGMALYQAGSVVAVASWSMRAEGLFEARERTEAGAAEAMARMLAEKVGLAWMAA